jgi:hypothetical protein
MSESPVQMSEKPESVLEVVFREYGERYCEIHNRAEQKIAEIEEKAEKKRTVIINTMKEVETLNEYLRGVDDELEEEYDLIIEKRNDEIDQLRDEVKEKLKALGFDVEFEVNIDSANYFNAPGSPRAYNYYRVFEDNKVIDHKNKKVYIVTVEYLQMQKPTETEYEFNEIDIMEHELVDSETPFANLLCDNIPWEFIRDIWRPHIVDFIDEIAKAEREKKLEETLKQVKEQGERGAWVYDYQHFLNALMKTAKQFNISL